VSAPSFGAPAKWLILRGPKGWAICPPCDTGTPKPLLFATGAEAIAAFARGVAVQSAGHWHVAVVAIRDYYEGQ
jgi:hypothetical protein